MIAPPLYHPIYHATAIMQVIFQQYSEVDTLRRNDFLSG